MKKTIIIICSIIIGLSTIFITQIPAKADETQEHYNFTGSNVFIPFYSEGVTYIGFILAKINFTYNNEYYFNINANAYYNVRNNPNTQTSEYSFWREPIGYSNPDNNIYESTNRVSLNNIPINNGNINALTQYLCHINESPHASPNSYITISAYAFINNNEFIPNIKSIMLGNGITESEKYYNYVRYIDINNNYFQLCILTTNSKDSATNSGIEKMILESRTYIVNGSGDEYNNGYTLGYEQGKEKGIEQGKDIGYKNGYDKANTDLYNKWYIGRYQEGYNNGAESAGNYTFLSLVGAIVDAPIKAISNMLNFDLLGFNMMQFFYALITICIIITIIKLLI